jgi:hypothetical protein
LTARVAREEDAEVIASSSLSNRYDACSKTPWINGFPRPGGAQFVPYHPNAAGMEAIAKALQSQLSR